MGSEIPNTGRILFQVHGEDPDGEPTVRAELVTAQGRVVTSTQPNAASFDWTFSLDVGPGVHYYFVWAVQADGDRLVASPVWTLGDEDLRITDLTVQPAIPTVHNPSLFTARVTNRAPKPAPSPSPSPPAARPSARSPSLSRPAPRAPARTPTRRSRTRPRRRAPSPSPPRWSAPRRPTTRTTTPAPSR